MDSPNDEELRSLYEGPESAYGTGFARESSRSAPRIPRYSIVNKPISGESKHGKENIGKFVQYLGKNDKDEPIYEYYEKVLATIVFTAPYRKLSGKDGKILCSSCDGLVPDKKYSPPKCQAGNLNTIREVLSRCKFKEEDIVKIGKEVTSEKGTLLQCGWRRGEGGRIFDLCPSADRRLKSHCKLGIYLSAFDHDRGRDFTMELFGMNAVRDKRYVSPLSEFEEFSQKTKIPMFGYQVLLCTAESEYGFVLKIDLKDCPPHQIKDVGLVIAMKDKFQSAEDSYIRRHLWLPKDHPNYGANWRKEQKDEEGVAGEQASLPLDEGSDVDEE